MMMKDSTFLVSLLCVLYEASATIEVRIPLATINSYDIEASDPKTLVTALSRDLHELLGEGDLDLGHLDFDVHHEAINARGSFDQLAVHNLNDFELCFCFPFLGPFNFTLRNLTVDGEYDLVEGDLGDLFAIFGNGSFWLQMENFLVTLTVFNNVTIAEDFRFAIDIDIDLGGVQNYFENFMREEELCKLFNGVIQDILPETLKILLEEAKHPPKGPLANLINDVFHNHNFLKLLKMHLLSNTKDFCIPMCIP